MQRLPAEHSDKISRTAYRAQKELDDARRAGTAAPAVDIDGNAINPHVPDFIGKAPWYVDTGKGPSLAHQRKDTELHSTIHQWYDRGEAGPAATKYRKGACENCGAMTHKRKDCVERPRRRGAKFTNKNIAADERVQNVPRDYDAKRDRWNGYDPASYKAVVDDYEAAEEARKKYREEEIDAELNKGKAGDLEAVKKVAHVGAGKADEDNEFGSSDDDEEEEKDTKDAEAADQVGQKFDVKNRMTVRNLRIREDTAKYLLNLDPESAFYDPKTRSMRDAPETGVKPEDLKFAGDNFHRYSGEATNMQKLQLFAWQSAQRGHTVDMHANPTAGELLHREFTEKRTDLKSTTKSSILEKYGGEAHLERLPQELLGGQSEHYVEYSRTGQVVKGLKSAVARSKYPEDVYVNNHTAVWGSYYTDGSWGYGCCHSLVAGSYCTGEAGKLANQATSAANLLQAAEEPEAPKSLAELHREKLASGKAKEEEPATTADDANDFDKKRLRAALAEEKKRKALGEEDAWEATKRSKTEVSKEEMEAYRLSKQAFDDPMANYKDTEE